MRNLSIITFLLVCFGCSDNNDYPEPFFILEENEINVGHESFTKKIYYETNTLWELSGLPDWCLIENKNDNGRNYLELNISPNILLSGRSAEIIITGDNILQKISIVQGYDVSNTDFRWYTMPFNTFKNATLETDQGETKCQILGESFFINPNVKQQLYLGSMIKDKTQSLTDVLSYDQFDYNPITISSFVNGKTYISEFSDPSYESTTAFSEEIISDLPSQNLNFYYQDAPIPYTSYSHLNILGMGNMGLNIDEIISYDQQMQSKLGLIYSYSLVEFSVIMDIPHKLIEDEIEQSVIDELLYVSSINYGKAALLLVEGIYNYNTMTSIVQKIMKKNRLDEYETEIASSLIIHYISFSNSGSIQNNSGGVELIKLFVEDINSVDTIPLTFTTSRYKDNSKGILELQFKLK